MSGEPLGITEHHQKEIRELLRYNRFKRSERLIGIDLCFKDFVETRLYDDETYTQDEVRDMIEQLGQTVKDECESEFIHSSDTAALLLRQLMLQADNWKLKLSADVQQLENRALIQLIRDFEKMESNLSTSKTFSPQKLTPLQDEGFTVVVSINVGFIIHFKGLQFSSRKKLNDFSKKILLIGKKIPISRVDYQMR